MKCKKCGSENNIRAGFIKGEQRYACKDCGCKFVPTRKRGRPEKDKILAVWLHMHGLSFRSIAKLFKVSPQAVVDWDRSYAKENHLKPGADSGAVIVDSDEMWRFLRSQELASGYGKLIAVIPVNLSTGNAEGAPILHFQNFSNE